MIRRGFVLLVAGCGGELSVEPERIDAAHDSARDADAAVILDAGPPCDALEGFVPSVLPPSSGRHQAKCSQKLLDLYHACVIGMDQGACSNPVWYPAKDCLGCLESTVKDSTWGPMVYVDSKTAYLNVEGCVNLVTDQTGPSSCGQLLHDAYECVRAACRQTCFRGSRSEPLCEMQALATVCQNYQSAYDASCSALTLAAYPDLDNCFQRQSETDANAVRVRMDSYFCGP